MWAILGLSGKVSEDVALGICVRRIQKDENLSSSLLAERTAGAKASKGGHVFCCLMSGRKVGRAGGGWAWGQR